MKKIPALLLLLGLCACSTSTKSDPSDLTIYVDPFIGTDGTGHTFPGPSLPFGMVQPGPDNTDMGWDYTSGYQLKDDTIIGFSNTRASGTGISEFGDVLLFPLPVDDDRFKVQKGKEIARPGYYQVVLSNTVKAELTCTDRVAFHRYTYPDKEGKLLLNFQHGLRFLTDSLVLDSEVSIDKDFQGISGYCHTRNWVERKYFFQVDFDQAFAKMDTLPRQAKENAPKFVLHFNLPERELNVKVALSSVSVEGAQENLEAELPHWNFDACKTEASSIWNQYLNRITIEADPRQKRIFYTALYHLFLQPSNIADADGRYRGADDQIHQAERGAYYSTLSLWDTYRAAHPLYTIMVPERVNGFIQTMLDHHDAQGYLPIWTAWGQENHCMIGNHAIPVIVDAFVKGFDGFDPQRALTSMVESTTENHLNSDWNLYN
ncbi:MAG: GH92 family glycosyl hydrolase, partial [Bacteroidota bacterium]